MPEINKPEIEKSKENKYPITISDWLGFLECNSQTNLSIYILIGSLIIALSINLSGLLSKINYYTIVSIVILAIFLSVIVAVFGYISTRVKLYQELTERIIEGELTKPEDILQEYDNKIRDTRKAFFR
jgi:hypothetical protein